MITSYFKLEKPIVKKYEYFELYSGFIEPNKFKLVYSEINENLVVNSGRKSLVCIDDKWEENKARIKDSHLYGDPEKRKVLKKALLAKWPGKKINKLLCETCHAYDTSEKAKEAGVKEGNGYCIAFDFSCSGKHSCTGWLPK